MKHPTSPFFAGNAAFLDILYDLFLTDPQQLPPAWHTFFQAWTPEGQALPNQPPEEGMCEERVSEENRRAKASRIKRPALPSWAPPPSRDDPFFDENAPSQHLSPATLPEAPSNPAVSLPHDPKKALLEQIRDFLRQEGYHFAHTNPVAPAPELPPPLFRFYATHKKSDPSFAAVKALAAAYVGPLSLETGTLTSAQERAFLYAQCESPPPPLTDHQKKELWHQLLEAHTFETTLGKLFPGAKRFSLEGADALMPGLHHLCRRAAQEGLNHVVFSAYHRGRLNLLTHLLKKPLSLLYKAETHPVWGTDDVPYHLGWETRDPDTQLLLTLLPNPSHLQAATPVMMGYVRGLQEQQPKEGKPGPLGVLIHGEAAFAGQGVVMESLMLQGLENYHGGGLIHIVLNNQVGFTTHPAESFPREATDVAHIVGAPILHVNGQDPEAVQRACDIAFAFRQTFHKDCVVNIMCFRRHGHNELDEPRFTNPLLYQAVDEALPVSNLYGQTLVAQHVLSQEVCVDGAKTLEAFYRKALKEPKAPPPQEKPQARAEQSVPACDASLLHAVGNALTHEPEHMNLHPKINRFIAKRREMLDTQQGIDWSLAESLALGSMLRDGMAVRLVGQDSVRGTFTQRHGAFIDQKTEARYVPLNHVSDTQAPLSLVNSPLSEAAALGFEIGYSWARDDAFVLWEAQFGDFANGAQVFIDQYLAVSAQKWGRSSSITLLLPHGYEGQGAEHSSARLERFLQLAARDNLGVAHVTTPAQFFHLLRRQAYTRPAKPLVVMTPKSWLRDPRATSPLHDVIDGSFQPVLTTSKGAPVHALPAGAPPHHILMCSGKVYYDLLASPHASGNVIFVRLEQLAPFPHKACAEALSPFAGQSLSVRWVQEEPENMGAWTYVAPRLHKLCQDMNLPAPLYKGRPPSDITATGFGACHAREQDAMIAQAFKETSS
ncbi:2-oxoglutarate dehydrogenase E1 component [bacterium NHP-B]|nr:2-oxoglutarate dehydrogenase E1 component [bacterium NHP-B]